MTGAKVKWCRIKSTGWGGVGGWVVIYSEVILTRAQLKQTKLRPLYNIYLQNYCFSCQFTFIELTSSFYFLLLISYRLTHFLSKSFSDKSRPLSVLEGWRWTQKHSGANKKEGVRPPVRLLLATMDEILEGSPFMQVLGTLVAAAWSYHVFLQQAGCGWHVGSSLHGMTLSHWPRGGGISMMEGRTRRHECWEDVLRADYKSLQAEEGEDEAEGKVENWLQGLMVGF